MMRPDVSHVDNLRRTEIAAAHLLASVPSWPPSTAEERWAVKHVTKVVGCGVEFHPDLSYAPAEPFWVAHAALSGLDRELDADPDRMLRRLPSVPESEFIDSSAEEQVTATWARVAMALAAPNRRAEQALRVARDPFGHGVVSRLKAIWFLGLTSHTSHQLQEIVTLLTELSARRGPRTVMANAARMLGVVGQHPPVEARVHAALVSLLDEPHAPRSEVVRAAASALPLVGEKHEPVAAWPVLISVVTEIEALASVRDAGARAIGAFAERHCPPDDVARTLLEVLEDPETPETVRRSVAWALSRIGKRCPDRPEISASLRRLATDERGAPLVRCEAAVAFGGVEQAEATSAVAWSVLLDLLAAEAAIDAVRRSVVRAMGRLAAETGGIDATAWKRLVMLSTSDDFEPHARRSALAAVAAVAPRTADSHAGVHTLIGVIADGKRSADDRVAAVLALGRFRETTHGTYTGWDKLTATLCSPSTPRSMRQAVGWTMGRHARRHGISGRDWATLLRAAPFECADSLESAEVIEATIYAMALVGEHAAPPLEVWERLSRVLSHASNEALRVAATRATQALAAHRPPTIRDESGSVIRAVPGYRLWEARPYENYDHDDGEPPMRPMFTSSTSSHVDLGTGDVDALLQAMDADLHTTVAAADRLQLDSDTKQRIAQQARRAGEGLLSYTETLGETIELTSDLIRTRGRVGGLSDPESTLGELYLAGIDHLLDCLHSEGFVVEPEEARRAQDDARHFHVTALSRRNLRHELQAMIEDSSGARDRLLEILAGQHERVPALDDRMIEDACRVATKLGAVDVLTNAVARFADLQPGHGVAAALDGLRDLAIAGDESAERALVSLLDDSDAWNSIRASQRFVGELLDRHVHALRAAAERWRHVDDSDVNYEVDRLIERIERREADLD